MGVGVRSQMKRSDEGQKVMGSRHGMARSPDIPPVGLSHAVLSLERGK